MPLEVPIRGEMIRLSQFLKLTGAVDQGGEAKQLVASGAVTVNGEVETRRGAQLHDGDVIRALGEEWRIAAAGTSGRL